MLELLVLNPYLFVKDLINNSVMFMLTLTVYKRKQKALQSLIVGGFPMFTTVGLAT